MEKNNSEVTPGIFTTTTTSSAPISSPVPNMFTRTQASPTPISSPSSDRLAVQVIQQAIPKPASVTTQYLQQVSQSNSRQSKSPTTACNENAAQTSPISQFQATNSSGSAGATSQHAMLLGNSSPPGSQAQMYLRTQMLILAPAASVSAELPALTSVSSQPGSSQVSSLSMRTNLPGTLTAAPSVQLKVTSQGPSLPKMSLCPLRSTHLSQALVETSSTFTPMRPHAVVRQQLHCTPSPATPPQLILQSSTAHRHVQPIALQVTPQDKGSPPLSLLTHSTPAPAAVLSQHCDVLSGPTSSDQPAKQTSVQQQAAAMSTSVLTPGCPTLLDTPPLHLGPAVEPLPQPPPLSCPPPPTMALPRLAVPPASLQRLSLRSVHALALQSDHMLVSDTELPGADAAVQLPFRNLPPPQTVAVDLKVQPPTRMEDPSSEAARLLKVDQEREKRRVSPSRSRTPTPPTLAHPAEVQSTCNDSLTHPKDCTGPMEHSCSQSIRSMIQSPEESALNTIPQPFLCAAVRSSSKLPPASLPASPEGQPSQAIVRPHILTHLIEGFVIREGLEPFPVGRTSLENQQQPELPQPKDLPGSAAPACHDFLVDEEHTESDIDNTNAEDERLTESFPDVLKCELCGKRGLAHTFLHSKRFCTMTCVRRFNVSCAKRLSILGAQRANRWPNRPMRRRGRPPSRVNHNSRDHFLTQLHGPYRPDNMKQPANSLSHGGGEESGEEDSPGPMTTRLRLQADKERNQQQGRKDSCTSNTCLSDSSPAQWSVEQVCSYINSLPGCQDIVTEFRSQEIDGQALLLLTEEHLMSVMNIKLGPALKICAHINSLKEP